MTCPEGVAAMAPTGNSELSTMANTAARKASERVIDHESDCERVTSPL